MMSALSDYFQSLLASPGANQPVGPQGAPSYGIGPGVLGMRDPMRMTGVPGALSMGYPSLTPPPGNDSLPQGAPPAPMPAHPISAAPSLPFESGFPTPPAIDATLPQFNVPPPAGALTNAPLPPPRPKGKIDPKTVDLGMNRRFVPIQYQVPSGRGPLGNNPIYTALNLGSRS